MATIQDFELIAKNIKTQIEDECQRIGILCRVFSRSKDMSSLQKKIEKKDKEFHNQYPDKKDQSYYASDGKKVQDIVGVRIVTYFYEDVNVLWNYFRKKYDVIDTNETSTKDNIFGVVTKNMVCQMTSSEENIFNETLLSYKNDELNNILKKVDSTFEIQFRTILSEGWHEIEHDLRYKNKEDWKLLNEDSRTLNGIYATLETSERAMKSLFNDVAYTHYKNENWEAMLRSKFRMHLIKDTLSDSLYNLINNSKEVSRELFKFERNELIDIIARSGLYIQLTLDNLVFVINFVKIHNVDIEKLMPLNIKMDLENKLNSFTLI